MSETDADGRLAQSGQGSPGNESMQQIPQGEENLANTSQGRVKRLTAEYRGDEAVEIDILEVMLRMGEVARTRLECDTKLVRLALKALDRAIADYCSKTGQRYPGYVAMAKYLDDRATGVQGEPVRVVNMQK